MSSRMLTTAATNALFKSS